MKIKELIEQLNKLNANLEVLAEGCDCIQKVDKVALHYLPDESVACLLTRESPLA